jgi:hypothetical protein
MIPPTWRIRSAFGLRFDYVDAGFVELRNVCSGVRADNPDSAGQESVLTHRFFESGCSDLECQPQNSRTQFLCSRAVGIRDQRPHALPNTTPTITHTTP